MKLLLSNLIFFLCTAEEALAFAPPFTKSRGIRRARIARPTLVPRYESSSSLSNQDSNDDKPQVSSTDVVQEADVASVVVINDEQTVLLAASEEQTIEVWQDESKNVELIGLLIWGISLSVFILVNNFVAPWPMPQMEEVPLRFWRVTHVVSGMLFGGGIIVTTAIEWLVASNKNPPVVQFWFDKVPLLDAAIVLPSLTISVISGTGLAIENYGGLGDAPVHIAITFYALVSFAVWWASTDLTTQGKALTDVNEWAIASTDNNTREMPKIVTLRRKSNVVSCIFVVALFAIMILKPGVIYWTEIADLFSTTN